MLKNKFWTGLGSIDLKNATRFLYLKDKVTFEELRTRVRATMYEMSHNETVSEKINETNKFKGEVADKEYKKNKPQRNKNDVHQYAQGIQQEGTAILKFYPSTFYVL